MDRGNSMTLTVDVPSLASAQGLFDIDGVQFGEIPRFRLLVYVRQSADADCVISIEYNSELLNHMSKN